MAKHNDANDDFFKGLEETLPPVFTRKTASKMTGGMFTARTLSNLDAAGKGPSSKLRAGKNVIYEKKDFIDWLHTTVRPKKEIARPVKRTQVVKEAQRNSSCESLPS